MNNFHMLSACSINTVRKLPFQFKTFDQVVPFFLTVGIFIYSGTKLLEIAQDWKFNSKSNTMITLTRKYSKLSTKLEKNIVTGKC